MQLWVTRRLEIDRAARTVRLIVKPKFRRASDESFAFEEVRELVARGVSWARLYLVTARGSRLFLVIPYSASWQKQLIEITGKLGEILGVAFKPQLPEKWLQR
jgi:hypothetical protein